MLGTLGMRADAVANGREAVAETDNRAEDAAHIGALDVAFGRMKGAMEAPLALHRGEE